MPTLTLWESIWALRSLLTRLFPRKFLRSLVLYLRLSPHMPHFQASRCCSSGESSHVQRSMRPELHALASAWESAADEMASRNAVSLKPEMKMQLSYIFTKWTLHTTMLQYVMLLTNMPRHFSLMQNIYSCWKKNGTHPLILGNRMPKTSQPLEIIKYISPSIQIVCPAYTENTETCFDFASILLYYIWYYKLQWT